MNHRHTDMRHRLDVSHTYYTFH